MSITFSYLVTTFFVSYLGSELGLSANTIASYGDCMRLLISYTCERHGIQPEAIDMQTVTPEIILDFLEHIEQARGNIPATRNQRLAAIKTFFHFLARHVPELMHNNERIQAIKAKATDHRVPPSLSVEEVNAILDQTDTSKPIGARDKALLQLMYNTGARVQELADTALSDLRMDTAPSVKLTGKGRKSRVIPLWEATVETIRHYLQLSGRNETDPGTLFLNARSEPMTRFGIAKRLSVYATQAARTCHSLQGRSITPHVFRHTTALHLIEAGNDIALVRDWLGHAHIKTTSHYIEVSLQRKRDALEKLPPPDGGLPDEQPRWKQPDIMDFLVRISAGNYVA